MTRLAPGIPAKGHSLGRRSRLFANRRPVLGASFASVSLICRDFGDRLTRKKKLSQVLIHNYSGYSVASENHSGMT